MAVVPKLEPPDASELAWIADNVAKAAAMAKKYGGDDESLTQPTLGGLDAVWVAFTATLRESGDDPNFLINMIGVAFGQYLVQALDMVWVVATDEYGTEMAVHGQPGDLLIYPTNLVAKRWKSGEGAFLASIGAQMIADISRLRKS
jgi:hypothetical protein